MQSIQDQLYGVVSIDACIQEIIQSPVFQRMKGIYMGGGAAQVCDEWKVTRYDHSIGVFILAKRLNLTYEEQLRALLHDISHTAFSHVIDYILDNRNETYHEEIQTKVIETSTIPQILTKYNIKLDVLYQEYMVLDAELPDISIDRIDYVLRDMFKQAVITQAEVKDFIRSLHVVNQKLIVQDKHMALWFENLFNVNENAYFNHPLNIISNSYLTTILKAAIKKEIISIQDLEQLTDNEILNKLLACHNQEIVKEIKRFKLLNMNNYNEYSIEAIIKPKKRWIKIIDV